MTKKDYTIVFAGVGGQGNITAIIILGEALIQKGFQVHSSETHGLGQRGGKVQTILRFCEKDIAPIPTVGTADLIIATEKSAILDVLKFTDPDKKTKIVIDSYKNEIVGSSSGAPGQEFALVRSPVLPGMELLVREEFEPLQIEKELILEKHHISI